MSTSLVAETDLLTKVREMETNLAIIKEFFQKVMVPGQDYGTIPGTDKPVLLKCGAEKLCELYGFAPEVKEIIEEKDTATGYYYVRIIIALHRKGTGEHVADGVGSATAWESKYRYRWVPEEEVSEEERANAKIRMVRGKRYCRVENENPHDLWNTVLKMAKKRALVDAVLTATRSSGIFTQDYDDLIDWIDVEVVEEKPEKQKQAEPKLTDKQLGYIRRLAQKRGLTEEQLQEYVEEHFQKGLEDLSQQEASRLIDVLAENHAEKK